MGREANKGLHNPVCAGLAVLALLVAGASQTQAVPVTTTYEFLPEQSTLVKSGGIAGRTETYTVEGQFKLTADFEVGVACFDQVDATYGQGWSLGGLLSMTELVGTIVEDTEIEFVGETVFGSDIVLTLTFIDHSVHLTGGYTDIFPDGYGNDLDAVAVPEPATILLVGVGAVGLLGKKYKALGSRR